MTDTDNDGDDLLGRLPVEPEPARWESVLDLVPWDQNPWKHPPAQVRRIADSIKRNGWGSPVLVHGETSRLLAGHGRRLGLLLLLEEDPEFIVRGAPGVGYLPVRRITLPLDQAVELALAENLADTGREEVDGGLVAVLREEFGGLEDLRERAIGLSEDDVRAIFEVVDPGDGAGGRRDGADYEPPEPPENPVSELGAVYRLGPHRLGCGDTLDRESDLWARLLEGLDPAHGPKGTRLSGRVDAVWTDPPYAIYGSSSGVSSTVADDKMVQPFFRDVLRLVARLVPYFGPAYLCCDWRSWPTLFDAARKTGSQGGPEAKNLVIWRKNGGLGSNWANSYECVSYFLNLPKQLTMSGDGVTGTRPVLAVNVIDEDKVHSSAKHHNAEKPVALIERMLNITEAGEGLGRDARPAENRWLDTVADPFGGSGSTLIACANSGRTCVTTELEPRYCDVIRARWGKWARANGVDPGPDSL